GKVLAPLGKGTVLELLMRRLRGARELNEIVVATSVEAGDEPIARLASELGVTVVRGPLDDVLERYRLAAAASCADAVARITADCPLLAPAVIDEVVLRWRETASTYTANTLAPCSFPDGMDVEVISVEALNCAGAPLRDPEER